MVKCTLIETSIANLFEIFLIYVAIMWYIKDDMWLWKQLIKHLNLTNVFMIIMRTQ